MKRYIDFAAEHGFDQVLVEGWNEGWDTVFFVLLPLSLINTLQMKFIRALYLIAALSASSTGMMAVSYTHLACTLVQRICLDFHSHVIYYPTFILPTHVPDERYIA